MSVIITKRAVPLRCSRCKHEWNYGGNNGYYACCPYCREFVNIKKNKILQPGQDTTLVQTAGSPNTVPKERKKG